MVHHILCMIRFSALALLIALAATLSLQACDGGGSGNSSDSGTISGQVTGLDAQGASVVVMNANGTIFGRSSGPVQGDGRYSVPVTTWPWPDHAIIQVEKDGRILRAVVLGYPGQGAYEAEDTFVTPDTEAAVLLCTVGQRLSVADYVLFLQASVNGTFAPDLRDAVTFPYRDLLAHASALAEEYFEGETTT
ncbi:MAG: hypothetical protein EOM25_05995, partial [Deltaproteobacteria bacterium]|nr:hypothetical protein [Deltaproteobacteria bacterium]